ncbi:glycosyltransferase family 2 protein [Chiayiivirga flava]|uniref:GT2 family glycosyltransferase n=1 Tax=Chiayiivirga flava TaxID=659595 RepID=A0A7W8D705_9GAMM|nr:glycosyltransferase family 2 protein [Chiayiivirga flava]MBB5208707.1 GT2 family glycosyltransferase [Chiayiivirga flava]
MLPIVVVPIFGASDVLDACLASLLRTLPQDARVLLCDDASPQPEIAPMLHAFARQAAFEVHIERRAVNLGFIGNVNRAFARTAGSDVVLLNSDTIATPGWLQALVACAETDPRVATATPWSNNAEICSFPDFCRAGPVPDDADAIARAAADEDAPAYPDLPTGVGFCMYVRRAALDRVGDFDAATFGRGYGEENDFCLRVAAHGWRNVLCDTAYVVHRGGASFGSEGHRPGGENLARLTARYPEYNRLVAEFILRDPLKPLRDRLAARIDAQRPQSAQRDLFA